MNADQFVANIASYWQNVTKNPEISKEILKEVQHAPAAALNAILRQLKTTIRPTYTVGVADVMEAARITGSALHVHTSKSFDVRCPCCQAQYSYQQGTRDVCPYCTFPYYEYARLKQYEQFGRPWAGYVNAYRKRFYDPLMKRCEKHLQRSS